MKAPMLPAPCRVCNAAAAPRPPRPPQRHRHHRERADRHQNRGHHRRKQPLHREVKPHQVVRKRDREQQVNRPLGLPSKPEHRPPVLQGLCIEDEVGGRGESVEVVHHRHAEVGLF